MAEPARKIRRAGSSAIVRGLDEYGAEVVGRALLIVGTGVPLAGFAAYAHFVLDAPSLFSAGLVGAGVAGAQVGAALRRRRQDGSTVSVGPAHDPYSDSEQPELALPRGADAKPRAV